LEPYIIGDTDVIIDFFSGKETSAALVHYLIQDNRLAVSSITAFELYAGITGKRRIQQIDRLFSFIPVLPFALTEAAIAAQIYNSLRQSGMLIGNQDICIAATCLARGLPLLTRNLQHFSRIKNLKLFTGSRS